MTLTELLLPKGSGAQVTDVHLENDRLVFTVSSLNTAATCPYCDVDSMRVCNHYYRRPADVPCAEYVVYLQMKVRCYFCDNEDCEHSTFGERFPKIIRPYARRTDRLSAQQLEVVFETSAEAGARILDHLTEPVSPDTLLRMVRKVPEEKPETPRVLGVDDWAKKKGQTYGTILVDLEKHQPIDVLPDRSAEALEEWLADHPGVEIITRDRSGEYAAGATAGAPKATQVADRFHLLQNLTDTLTRMFDRQPQNLREAAKQAAESMSNTENQTAESDIPEESAQSDVEIDSVSVEPEPRPHTPGQNQTQAQSTAQWRFDQVKMLQEQSLSQRVVAKQLQIDRRTVRRYWLLDEYPKRQPGPQAVSSVTPYSSYLLERWQEGEQNRKVLWKELQEQGYAGSYASVWRATKQLADDGVILIEKKKPALKVPALSPRRAAWIFSVSEDDLKPEHVHLRNALLNVCQGATEVYRLAQDFGEMIRKRRADVLDPWLLKAKECVVGEFQRFSDSLKRDYAAVKAALELAWSNGQVEGQVNRLKFIKRQMYGRANFDLLRRRILGVPVPTQMPDFS